MKKAACKICGSTEIKIEGDTISCLSCGNKYTLPQKKFDKVHRVKIDKTDDAKNYLKRAQHFYIDGDMSECREYCDKILDIDATNIDALFLFGKANFIYDYNQAETHLKKVMFQDSKYFDKNITEFINEIKSTIEKNATIKKQLDRIESFIRLLIFLKKHSDAIQVSEELEYVYTFFDKHFTPEELNEIDEKRFLDTMEKILSIITKEKSLSPKRQKLFMNTSCDFITDYIPGIYEMFAKGYFHSPSERDFPNNKDGEVLTGAINVAVPYVNRLLECCPEADDEKKFEICSVMIEYLDLYIDATLKDQNKFFAWKDEHKEKYQKEMDRFKEIRENLNVEKAEEDDEKAEDGSDISGVEEQEQDVNEPEIEDETENAVNDNSFNEEENEKKDIEDSDEKNPQKASCSKSYTEIKISSKIILACIAVVVLILLITFSIFIHIHKNDASMQSNIIIPHVEKYKNGQVKIEGNFKNGKQDGLVKSYYKNGQLQSESNWKDDMQDGPTREYHENGQLKSEGNWKSGKQDGLVKSYYENGQLQIEINWKNGKKEGRRKEYYKNGQLKEERTYKDDKKEDIWKEYTEDGVLKRRISYRNGKLEGNTEEYYPSGNVKTVYPFENDQLHGLVKQYDEKGNLVAEIEYNNGEKTEPKLLPEVNWDNVQHFDYWSESVKKLTNQLYNECAQNGLINSDSKLSMVVYLSGDVATEKDAALVRKTVKDALKNHSAIEFVETYDNSTDNLRIVLGEKSGHFWIGVALKSKNGVLIAEKEKILDKIQYRRIENE